MALSTLQVMVVEDHGFQRKIALRLLGELGIQTVDQAADGHEALAQLEQRAQPPDVILVDLDMPGMDGIQFIGHIAKRKLARALVVASALDPALLNTVQNMARAYGLRVLGCVEKPLTADKLNVVLSRFDDVLLAEADEEPVEVEIGELRAALHEGRIVAWFQPQVEFGNGKAVGVEALARWQREDGSVVRPMHFVPLLEREGLVDVLTEQMLAQACSWKQRWDGEGTRLHVSVNISPSSLTHPEIADRYEQIVREHTLDPGDIVLEITESSVMADAAHGLGVLARLRLKGFGLSIDDFGTGYSSLAQLSQIPFTELKIDRGFVSRADEQPRKRAVIEASLELARKLDLAVVAEGVETEQEWQLLAELGCGIAQGYLIARPVPGAEVFDAIGRWRQPGS